MGHRADVELTLLMPCLNEARSIAICVAKARTFLDSSGITGEILVADNGSTDGSVEIAGEAGARVIHVASKGYGAALLAGIQGARGTYIIMGDSDGSYDFSRLESFIGALRGGSDLVVGNRFKGGIAPGAMPFLHRYLGNPVLSAIGRLFFSSSIGDYHCGLRGFVRDRILALELKTTGMEFASEMIVSAALKGYRLSEVPITLSPDLRGRPPHLNTWRDGWRHLVFLLIYSPRWLFLYPGMMLLAFGLAGALTLTSGPVDFMIVQLDIHSLLVSCFAILIGFQAVGFSVLVRRLGLRMGFLPKSTRWSDYAYGASLNRVLLLSLVLMLLGLFGFGWCLMQWAEAGFGPLEYAALIRYLTVSVTAIALGIEGVFLAFLFAVLDISVRRLASGTG